MNEEMLVYRASLIQGFRYVLNFGLPVRTGCSRLFYPAQQMHFVSAIWRHDLSIFKNESWQDDKEDNL